MDDLPTAAADLGPELLFLGSALAHWIVCFDREGNIIISSSALGEASGWAALRPVRTSPVQLKAHLY